MIETIGAIKGITPIEILALIVLVLSALWIISEKHKQKQKELEHPRKSQKRRLLVVVKCFHLHPLNCSIPIAKCVFNSAI